MTTTTPEEPSKSSVQPELEFEAEIKQVAMKKLVSNDVGFTVVLHTEDQGVLALGTVDADATVHVTVRTKQ